MAGTPYFVSQGSKLYIMNQTVSPHVAVAVAALNALDGLSGQKSSIKLSNFDSGNYDEYAPGMVDPGKPSGQVFVDVNSAAHQLLHRLVGMGQGAQTSFFYGLSDGTAAPTVVAGVLTVPQTGASAAAPWARSGYLFDGFVSEFAFSSQTNNVLMAKFSAQVSGPVKMAVKGGTTLLF